MIVALLSSKELSENVIHGVISKKLDIINNLQMAAGKHEETIVYAVDYPSSIVSLLRAISIADTCIIIVNQEVSSLDAELVLAVEYSGISEGIIVYDEYSDTASFSKFFSAYKAGKFRMISAGEEYRFESASEGKNPGLKYISIDKHFIVKGIGNVILGFTLNGSVNKGDRMVLLPSLKEVAIKSIQVMDKDVSSAESGLHVGLALNNVNENDLDLNYSVSSSKEISNTYKCKLVKSALFKGDPFASKGLCCSILGKNLTVALATGENSQSILFNKPIIRANGKHVLADASLSVGKNRIVGSFELD